MRPLEAGENLTPAPHPNNAPRACKRHGRPIAGGGGQEAPSVADPMAVADPMRGLTPCTVPTPWTVARVL